ncbi:MAG: ferric reductase-like transmembrane domain-containing protein [Acidimicrobiales bacterium]|nr:ferric reductase-like transmembrane domain-containing protein [Acidimicrobiales bacterium]
MELTDQFWWYTSRSAGLVAWGVLTLSLLWGLLASTKLRAKMVPGYWVLDVHRFLGGLSVTFTAIHVLALIPDAYVEFGPRELLIPGASSWQPEAVAWGVVGMYVLLAVELTSLMMNKLPRKLWRAVHMLSFGLFVVATVHGVRAGTDAAHVIFRWAGVVSVQLVLFLVIARLMSSRKLRKALEPAPSRSRATAIPASAPPAFPPPASPFGPEPSFATEPAFVTVPVAPVAPVAPPAPVLTPPAASPRAARAERTHRGSSEDRAARIAAAKAALADRRAQEAVLTD